MTRTAWLSICESWDLRSYPSKFLSVAIQRKRAQQQGLMSSTSKIFILKKDGYSFIIFNGLSDGKLMTNALKLVTGILCICLCIFFLIQIFPQIEGQAP